MISSIKFDEFKIDTISADATYPLAQSKIPAVIGIHGFLAFKDTIFWPVIAQWFAKNNFYFLKFNFTHNGIGADKYKITEFEKLKNNTLSLEYTELSVVVDFVQKQPFIDKNRIFLFGHSLGGFLAINYAAQHQDKISKLVSWAQPISLMDKLKKEAIRVTEDAFIIYSDVYDREIEIGKNFIYDYEKNKHKFDILKNVKNINKPLLILHSEEDETVPIEESELLYNHSNKHLTQFIKLENGGHSFILPDGKIDVKNLKKAFAHTLEFLKSQNP